MALGEAPLAVPDAPAEGETVFETVPLTETTELTTVVGLGTTERDVELTVTGAFKIEDK